MAPEYVTSLLRIVRPAHVTAMAGNTVFLPCETQPSAQDKVEMVLWFKKANGQPIYTYDVRGRPMSQPISSFSAIGTRAYFHATTTPAILLLEHVTPADNGIYRCRVDFLTSPTRNYSFNLTVITPPNQPTIIDARTQDSIRLLEPYNEGDTIELLCEVNGGNPRPRLIWYLENTIIDETFEEEDNGVTSNALTFPRLGREHLNARLSCQASNTNLSSPPSKLLILNINLRPLSVQIVRKQEQLSADRSYDVECIVTGSRPAPQITWWIGSKPLRDNVINFSQSNLTRSVLQLVPKAQDHERMLICRAENPHLRAKSLEDTWKLAVQYVPIVSLKMSSSNNSNHITEGDNVYLECTARANPRPSKFFWFKQGIQLEQDTSAGVFVSEQSLVLLNVIRNGSGEYKCAAQNDEGKATSNPVNLQVRWQ
ncbi:synaptogenesis protein syg-2-like [Pieris brassicae]|uniref:synaptogenesis protein syg-2-like n=1 Tax=Pieris brassicae TaxID=7116 RepID=UPI001E660402|nr:synaptogenesis protein syg-2-like [Pieris brassicae]